MMQWIDIGYIIASALFIFGLKMLNRAESARRGNLLSALGMLLAIVITLFKQDILSFQWILVGLVSGSLLGILAARLVKMTSMPEMVALFNGFGGISSLLVGWAEYHASPGVSVFTSAAIGLAVIIGGMTFTGSLVAVWQISRKNSRSLSLFSWHAVCEYFNRTGFVGRRGFIRHESCSSW